MCAVRYVLCNVCCAGLQRDHEELKGEHSNSKLLLVEIQAQHAASTVNLNELRAKYGDVDAVLALF